MSPSFTGRPFIEGRTIHTHKAKSRRRRPLRDGLSLRVNKAHVPCLNTPGSPSFTGRPFIEGTSSVWMWSTTAPVAVLYGTAFH